MLSSVSYGAPQLPIVSNVTGRLASSAELCSAEYWVRQVRSAVRFVDGVGVLEAEGVGASLELGPDGILTALTVRACRKHLGCKRWRRNVAGVMAARRCWRRSGRCMFMVLGLTGRRSPGRARASQVVGLPTYAFQRQRYWLEAEEFNPAEPKNGVDASFWKAVQSGSMERIEQLLQLSESGQREHLSALLPALSNWYEQTEAKVTVDRWCYEEQWQRTSVSASSGVTDGASPAATGGLCWLVSGTGPTPFTLSGCKRSFEH